MIKMILKTHRKTEAEKTTEEVLKLLYHLEDLNSYRKNKLNSVIVEIQNLKWRQE